MFDGFGVREEGSEGSRASSQFIEEGALVKSMSRASEQEVVGCFMGIFTSWTNRSVRAFNHVEVLVKGCMAGT